MGKFTIENPGELYLQRHIHQFRTGIINFPPFRDRTLKYRRTQMIQAGFPVEPSTLTAMVIFHDFSEELLPPPIPTSHPDFRSVNSYLKDIQTGVDQIAATIISFSLINNPQSPHQIIDEIDKNITLTADIRHELDEMADRAQAIQAPLTADEQIIQLYAEYIKNKQIERDSPVIFRGEKIGIELYRDLYPWAKQFQEQTVRRLLEVLE